MFKDYYDIDSVEVDISAIKISIKNILTTARGSVPGKPTFGSDLFKIIFSQLDALTELVAKNYVVEALTKFEKRIIIENVVFTKIEEYNRLVINITFYYNDSLESTSIAINV